MAGERAHARVQLHVRGLVQGVWFRASTRDEALRLGLTGWVRNEPDGSVTALAEGPRSALEALVQWARRGPPNARVDDLDVQWDEPTGEHDDFTVRRA
jgi:acylphosphatase